MFCGKCGTNIPDGALFCPDCGTPVTEEAAPAQQPAEQPITEEMPTQAEVSPTAVQVEERSASIPEAPFEVPNAAEPAAQPPKKRRKWWIGVLIAVVVLVAAAVAAWFLFPRDVQHLLFGDEKYASRLAEKSATTIVEEISETLTAQTKNGKQEAGITTKLILEMGDDLRTMLREEADIADSDMELVDALVTYLNGLSITAEGKVDDDIAAVYQITDADGALATAQVSLNGQQMTVRVPEICDDYIALDLGEEYGDLFNTPEIDGEKLGESLKALADTYIEALDGAEYSYEKDQELSIHGVAVTADCTVVKLSGTELVNLLISLLETARDDDYLQSVFEDSFSSLLEMTSGSTSMDYTDMLNELIDELKDAKEDIKEAKLSLSIRTYLDRRNRCVGKQYVVAMNGEKVTLGMVLGDDQAMSFKIGSKEAAYFTYKADGAAASGELAINANLLDLSEDEKTFVGLSFTASELKETTYAGAPTTDGSFVFKLYDPKDLLAAIVPDEEIAAYIQDARLAVTVKTDDDTQNTSVRLQVKELGTVGFEIKTSTKAPLVDAMPAQTADNTHKMTMEQLQEGEFDEELLTELREGVEVWAEKLLTRKSLEDLSPIVEELVESLQDPAEALAGKWVATIDLSDYVGAEFYVDRYMTLTADGKFRTEPDAEKIKADFRALMQKQFEDTYSAEDVQMFGYGSLAELQEDYARLLGYATYDEYLQASCDDLIATAAQTVNSTYTCDGETITVDGDVISYTLDGDTLILDDVEFKRVS